MPTSSANPDPPSRFSVGDPVRWTSEGGLGARGNREFNRQGEVVAVVEAEVTPFDALILDVVGGPRLPAELSSWKFMVNGIAVKTRPEVSYLVLVRPPTGRAKPRLYWPRAGLLRKEEE